MTAKIALAIFVVAFISVYFTFRQADQYAEFMKTAQKTQALVLKKEERIADPKNRRKEYWITYKYSSKGGYNHTAMEQLEYQDIWQRLREGQSADIYFNPAKPSQSHLASAIERRLGK